MAIQITDAQAVENGLLTQLREKPDLVHQLDKAIVIEFAESKLALKAALLATDPVGIALGAMPTPSPQAQEAERRYLAALDDLEANVQEVTNGH